MKKALVILSGLILLLGILSVTVMASESNDAASEETDESGTCGENINWTLTGSDSDLTLTLSGNGEMGDYSESSVVGIGKV